MAIETDLTTITRIVKQYGEALRKNIRVTSLFLFGSYARGTANAQSDIDVIVVSPDLTDDPVDDLLLLMRGRRQIDLRIEPHPMRSENFSDDNPFYLSIKDSLIKVA